MAAKRPLVNNSGAIGELSTSDVVAVAALGTGTPSSGTLLRGDGAWITGKAVYVSTTAPGSPATNDLWLDIS